MASFYLDIETTGLKPEESKILTIQPLGGTLHAIPTEGDPVPVNNIKGQIHPGCTIEETSDWGKYIVVTENAAPPAEECET